MIYISCDLETTGLSSDSCSIIAFGAAIEDTSKKLPLDEIPTFHRYLTKDIDDPRAIIQGEPFGLAMNKDILHAIATRNADVKIIEEDTLEDDFWCWLVENGMKADSKGVIHITIAGKNFGSCDYQFIKKLNWGERIVIRHRMIDAGTAMIDWEKDSVVPGLEKCKERAGYLRAVSHDAVEDSLDVIKVLRTKY